MPFLTSGCSGKSDEQKHSNLHEFFFDFTSSNKEPVQSTPNFLITSNDIGKPRQKLVILSTYLSAFLVD